MCRARVVGWVNNTELPRQATRTARHPVHVRRVNVFCVFGYIYNVCVGLLWRPARSGATWARA